MKIESGKFYKTRDGRKAECRHQGTSFHGPNSFMVVTDGEFYSVQADGREYDYTISPRDIMAEWTDERPWGELTDAEKGALLLAKHEGKEIQTKFPTDDNWHTDQYVKFNSPNLCYRVKPPEPVVETRTGTGWASSYKHVAPSIYENNVEDTFKGKWTAEVKDGVPQKITWELSDV